MAKAKTVSNGPMTFKIEDNVPLPVSSRTRKELPLDQLKPNQSFEVLFSDISYQTVAKRVREFQRETKTKAKFKVRMDLKTKSSRVWRTE